MADEEVIRLRLSRLEESPKKLSEIARTPEGEYLSSWRLRDLTERNLEVDHQLVYRRIQDLSTFRDFAAAVKKDPWG